MYHDLKQLHWWPNMKAEIATYVSKRESLWISSSDSRELQKTWEADSMLYRTFKILARIGPVAYKLALPDGLQRIHNPFHVANLKRCLSDENLIISLDEIQLDDKLHFIEEPVEIIDHEVKQLKQSRIPIVKVRWNS
nr:reverse transcriptase domain-containing protein [Tanacetum cinerariifolium]